MKDWDLLLLVVVYTIVMVGFGGWAEWRIIQYQMPRIADHYWTDGCRKCAQFEKDACERDQLQGVPEHKKIPQ